MSWHITVGPCARGEFEAVAREAFMRFLDSYSAGAPEREATAAQFEAGLTAVAALVPAVQPDPEGFMGGTMSGHANPDHQPRLGWSLDTVTLSLYQAMAPAPPAPDDPQGSLV